MSEWLDDKREIVALMLRSGENFDRRTGDRFERIEKAGQSAYVPWVRIETYSQDGVSCHHKRIVEAPLDSLTWIEFFDG